METKIIIVGAGIAGITTGCYACMNGYKPIIFEMHSVPGGLCAAWKRKGYTFDISMHLLTGSKGGTFHAMWKELGALQDQPFHYHDDLLRVEGREKNLTFGMDPRRLEEEMIALSPADAGLSKQFVRLISGKNLIKTMTLKPAEMMTAFDGMKMMSAVLGMWGTLRKCGKLTIQEFAQRFQDPFLREAVRFTVDSPGWPMPQFPLFALSGFLHSAVREAGVPVGGSQKFVSRMADQYLKLGGEVQYESRVIDILVENDRAVGVRLADGSEHRADVLVWAGDGHSAIFDILGGRYLDDEIRNMYSTWMPVLPIVHVAMGVNRDFSKEAHRIVIELERPIVIAGQEHRWLYFLHHSFDPTMAPPGKSATEVWFATHYEYWEELARDRPRYEAEKKRIADLTIAALDRRWPGFASQVEVVDVPTPMTYVRYTGNWKGSPDGWYITRENMGARKPVWKLPGLSGFYMAGQWTRPFTGTILAALSGRQLIELLCKQDGKRFVTGRKAGAV